MIGLEGSGFTICLGLILLLTGVVMYYCRKKIVECEHKVDSMFNLVAALNDELTELKNNQKTTYVNSNSEGPSVQYPYQELIPVNVNNDLDNRSDDSASEDDSDNENDNDNDNDNDSHDIKVVDIENLVVSEDDNNDEMSEDEELDEESSNDELDTNEIKEIVIEEKVDYSKFSVSDLKKMVAEKQLANSVSRLRKPELIALLSQ
jgi:hypothetical protein